MESSINEFEEQVVQLLLAGDDPVLSVLRHQLNNATLKSRELTGYGFFTEFHVTEQAPRIPGLPSFQFGDVIGELEGLNHGVGFVVFVEKGAIVMVEGYTYDEPWPEIFSGFELRYMSGTVRDFAALRATPGWPKLLF